MVVAADSSFAYLLGEASVREVAPNAIASVTMTEGERLVFVRHSVDSVSRLDLTRLVEGLEQQLHLSREAVTRTTTSLIGLMGPSRDTVHVVNVLDRPSLSVVVVSRVGTLPSPWGSTVPSLGSSSLRSMVIRHARAAGHGAGWSDRLAEFVDDIARSSILVIDATSDNIVQTLVDAGRTNITGAAGRHGSRFREAVESRARLQRALFLLRHEGVRDPTTDEIEVAIRGVDAAITALAGVASIELREQIEKSNDARQLDANRSEARDRLLARIGAALLLPSLWFSYLGMNLLPSEFRGASLQTWYWAVVIFVTGIVLAAVGWIGATLLTTRAGVDWREDD